jgi:hypothetical protein
VPESIIPQEVRGSEMSNSPLRDDDGGAMERSEWRRSILDFLKAREGEARAPFSARDLLPRGEVQPAPLAPARHALVEDALEALATEGFIERQVDGQYHLTPEGIEQLGAWTRH